MPCDLCFCVVTQESLKAERRGEGGVPLDLRTDLGVHWERLGAPQRERQTLVQQSSGLGNAGQMWGRSGKRKAGS